MSNLHSALLPATLEQYTRVYANLGFVPIPLREKIPVIAEWQKLPADVDAAVKRLRNHPGNIGLALPDDLFVIDVDRKAGKDGLLALQALESKFGELPGTLTQITASGGLHYVFRKPPQLLLKNSVNQLGDGLDIRTRGGQVVAEPSVINGKEYAWQDWDVLSAEIPEIADAPDWMLEILSHSPEPLPVSAHGGGQIVEGNRNQQLFQIAAAMRSRGDCTTAILAQLRHDNKIKCSPPLDDAELQTIANSVNRYSYEQSHGVWPEPLPLITSIAAEPYPLDALPDTLRAAVEEVQAFTKAPIPLVASSALAALSLAVQAQFDIKRAEKLTGPVSLFLLTIADSGERKSTCDGFFMGTLRDHEAQQAELAKPLLKDYRADMEAWSAKCSGVRSKITQLAKSGKHTDELQQRLRDLEHDKPAPPRIPKLVLGDETPENLAWRLAKEWPSAGIVSSEAGTVFGSHGMGKDNAMRNMALLNVMWDGGVHSVGRRTSESFSVRGVRLTMALQVQETALRNFFDRSAGLARGIGFMARFLIAWPESTQGTRKFCDPPETWPALARFNRRLGEILDQGVTIDEDGALKPYLLSPDSATKQAWVLFHDAIESELSAVGELYNVRDVASKTADNAARIAALFQVFEHGMGGIVSLPAFEGASRIAAWHLNEARRFFNELGLSEAQADAVHLDRWLIQYCQREQTLIVPRREIQRNITPIHLRKKAALDRALQELTEHERIREIKDGARKDIHINPEILREDDQ